MPLFKTIRDIRDGKPFAANHSGPGGLTIHNTWPWISGCVADQFDCHADDVHCLETEAGDVITAKGEPVAYFDDGYGLADFASLHAAVFPTSFAEATE